MNVLSTNQWITDQDKAEYLIPGWQRLVNLMSELCDSPGGFIVQAGEDDYKVIISHESEENPYSAGAMISTDVNMFCREVVQRDKELYVGNASERPEWLSNPEVTEDGFNTYLGYPLHWPNGAIFGTICIMDFAKTNYDDRYFRLIEHFRDMAEKELDLLSKNIQLESYALNDELTNLLNRKGFSLATEHIIKFAKRESEAIGVFYFDLDNLKALNDNHGHQVGDQAIKKFAQHLTATFRDTDAIARFGGDEFLVLFIRKQPNDADVMLKRLTKLVESETSHPSISFSHGYTSSPVTELCANKLEALIQIADKKMYEVKRTKK